MAYWKNRDRWELLADYAVMGFIGAVIVSFFILAAGVAWTLIFG